MSLLAVIAQQAPSVMDTPIPWLEWTGIHMSPWKLIGWVGALMFGSRWLVQFIASKRAKKPVIPRVFWYMSIVGSIMTLSYFVWGKNDSVGILQNLGYRKFNRPFWRVWQVGSGRASAALGTDRAQIGGSCVGFRHRGATQRLSA